MDRILLAASIYTSIRAWTCIEPRTANTFISVIRGFVPFWFECLPSHPVESGRRNQAVPEGLSIPLQVLPCRIAEAPGSGAHLRAQQRSPNEDMGSEAPPSAYI